MIFQVKSQFRNTLGRRKSLSNNCFLSLHKIQNIKASEIHKCKAVQPVEKVQLELGFSRLYDKMVLGDERCWNEGNETETWWSLL